MGELDKTVAIEAQIGQDAPYTRTDERRLDRHWFYSGLFLTTLATLALEILDTRFLSVMSWYHISFFAVSMAMFGMSAGAVHVYLGRSLFEGVRAAPALA
jgi:hypothetical protein